MSKIIHGMKHHPLYGKWKDINNRCANPNNKNYRTYGGRGITVCDEWKKDFKAFYDYVTQLSHYGEKGMTLDREDNDKGYEPNNVRWVNMHIQAVNKGLKGSNTSGYTGVARNGSGYSATLFHKGKLHYIKTFKSKYEAVWARNNFIIDNELWEYKLQTIR